MSKVSFALKDPKAKTTAIKVLYTCSDGRLPYYTGESTDPKLWPDKITPGTKAILSRIEATIKKTVESYKIIGDPLTKEALRVSLDRALNRQSKVKASDMFAEMEKVVDLMRSGEILNRFEKRYSAGTLKNISHTITVLRRFDPALSIASTTIQTYYKFITWCQKQDWSINFIGAQVNNWKVLGKEIGGNDVFENPDFKKISEQTDDIYLDEAELKAIIKMKLPDREDLVRDWFILDCYTGLRVSDLIQLSKKNIGAKFITIANEKTDEKVTIPIHREVKKILTKYNGLPPAVTDVEINRVIKTVAFKAGIDSDFLYTITKGGVRQDHYLKKWEMVSNHTARRSLITNLRKMGVPDTVTMQITGIKSEATLRRYDKLTSEEAASIAAGMKFFK